MSAAVEPAGVVPPTSPPEVAPPAAPPPLGQRIKDALAAPLRDPSPILLKELRATLRTPAFVRFLYLATGLVSIVVMAGGAGFASGSSTPADVGRTIYHIFFTALTMVLVVAAPGYAATALTSEKETKAWESLLLSGMSAGRIVWGKYVAVMASILLVVIAVSPVIGVAFLFGGVSPVATMLAFFWVTGLLSILVSFGIAVSARFDATRVAISVATTVSIPTFFFLGGFVIALGEAASSGWSTAFDGPFWFGNAFAERLGELDAWALLVLLPAFLVVSPTWFFLASAVAAVRPPSEDRSTELKGWAIFTILGVVAAISGVTAVMTGGSDAGEGSVAMAMFAHVFVILVVALTFANEPPLPPRDKERVGGIRGFVRLLVGPGAGPTLRFALLTVVGGTVLLSLAPAIVRHVLFTSVNHERFDVAALVLALAGGAVLAAITSSGAALRIVLRNGAAARVLTLALFGGVTMIAVVLAVALDPSALDNIDDEVPAVLGLSPAGPLLTAIAFADDGSSEAAFLTAAVALVGYGLAAAALWIFVEARARDAQHREDERRARIAARAVERWSKPPESILRRSSVPPEGGSTGTDTGTGTGAGAGTSTGAGTGAGTGAAPSTGTDADPATDAVPPAADDDRE